IPEIITSEGPGPNNPAKVTIWKYNNGSLTEYSTITAFDGYYGANITSGDIDGDGKAEIITGTGPDPKNSSIVRAYKPDGTLVIELKPYDEKYGYGVTVASGDINGDRIDDIITGLGPGPQNNSWVKVFSSNGSEIYSFTAYSDDVKYGVRVSSGRTGE
ncbi:MAG: VCBS repeat-containing protein, partial [Nitrospirae bacterium]|nr:VCBS repeat-containing protein [Nitrospirota bacterium]